MKPAFRDRAAAGRELARRLERYRGSQALVLAMLDLLRDAGIPLPLDAERLDELDPYAVEARYGLVEPGPLNRGSVADMVTTTVVWAQDPVVETACSDRKAVAGGPQSTTGNIAMPWFIAELSLAWMLMATAHRDEIASLQHRHADLV